MMDRFYYDIVASADGVVGAEKIRALIEGSSILRSASEPWRRASSPIQSDLYALLFVASPEVAADEWCLRKLSYASSYGFPVIPVVDSISSYDFSRVPLREIAERNALALDQPDKLIRTLLHHGGLELYEGGGKVFVSYARADGSELTEAIRSKLLQTGIGQTVDLYAFPGGEVIQDEISERIAAADLVVLVDSEKAHASRWVTDEIDLARAAHTPVVAVTPASGGFQYAFGTPHVEWVPGVDVVEQVLRYVRRFLARKQVFRDRVNRTLVRIANLRSWSVGVDGERWTLAGDRLHPLVVEATDTLPSVERISSFRTRIASSRGLLVGGTRPFPAASRQAFLMAGGAGVRATPLPAMAAKLTTHAARRPLARKRVFLSASMPSDENDAELAKTTLEPFVVSLTQSLVELGAVLVFGGHPSITPLIHRALNGVPQKRRGRIELHQARRWQSDLTSLRAEVKEGPVFKDVVWHGSGLDASSDVDALREGMIAKDLDAGVFVGGKTTGYIGTRPGIADEHNRFRAACPDAPVFVVGLAGGAATLLPPQDDVVDRVLRTTPDPDLAVATIIAELLRL